MEDLIMTVVVLIVVGMTLLWLWLDHMAMVERRRAYPEIYAPRGEVADYANRWGDAPELSADSSVPAVQLGTPVLFDLTNFPRQRLAGGEGDPATTLTWSTAHDVHIDFMLAEVENDIVVELSLYPFLADPAVKAQPVAVAIDDNEIAQWRFGRQSAETRQLRIPAGLIKPGVPFRMTFHLPDARLMRLGVKSITFSVKEWALFI